MSNTDTLISLESLLESFLDRVVNMKEKKLSVLEGINSLDDISRMSSDGLDVTDEIGGWFARHNRWLTDHSLKDGELNRITDMLTRIKTDITKDSIKTPAKMKIQTEIDRWSHKPAKTGQKMTLKRPPETAETEDRSDTISLFIKKLSKLTAIFMDHSGSKQHILTVLDEVLLSASTQMNKDALILSAFIIYYLKQNGYMVEPYVKKLKEAETLYRKGMFNA